MSYVEVKVINERLIESVLSLCEKRFKAKTFDILRGKRRRLTTRVNYRLAGTILSEFNDQMRKRHQSICLVPFKKSKLEEMIEATLLYRKKVAYSLPILKIEAFLREKIEKFKRIAFSFVLENSSFIFFKKSQKFSEFLRFFFKTVHYKNTDFCFYRILKRDQKRLKIHRFFSKKFSEQLVFQHAKMSIFESFKKNSKTIGFFHRLYPNFALSKKTKIDLITADLGIKLKDDQKATDQFFKTLLFFKFLKKIAIKIKRWGLNSLKLIFQTEQESFGRKIDPDQNLLVSQFTFQNSWMRSNLVFDQKEDFASTDLAHFESKKIDNLQLDSNVSNLKVLDSHSHERTSAFLLTQVHFQSNQFESVRKSNGMIVSATLQKSKAIIRATVRLFFTQIKISFELIRTRKKTLIHRESKIIYGKVSMIKQKTVTAVTFTDHQGKSIIGTRKSFLGWLKRKSLVPEPNQEFNEP